MKTNHKGLFITFEGGEGAGKSSILNAVFDQLSKEGFLLIKTREPGGSLLGEKIRELLLEKQELQITASSELLLFLASRAELVHECILPALKEGQIVLCDRFHDSSIVYQGIVRGLGEERVREMTYFASGGVVPDLTLLFDIDPQIGLKRVSKLGVFDRIESETITFHEKIRMGYLALAEKEKNRIKIINASQDYDMVYHDVLETIRDFIERFSFKNS